MSFIITCPVCGPRNAYEFRYGNQDTGPMPDQESLNHDQYLERVLMQPAGLEPRREWWCHNMGCGTWFNITRDPKTGREV